MIEKLALNLTEKKDSNQYKGIIIKLAGRLKGSQRDKKFVLSHHNLPGGNNILITPKVAYLNQSKNPLYNFKKGAYSYSNFSQKPLYTKWGIISTSIQFIR